MFDTPDLSPLCFAPLVSLVAGVFIYIASYLISSAITDKKNKKRSISFLIAILLMPLVCILSIVLRIGEWSPSPWFTPRSGNVVGTWVLDFQMLLWLHKIQVWMLTMIQVNLISMKLRIFIEIPAL